MRYAVGVDLGGTKIEASLVDEEGNRVNSSRVPTEVDKGPERMFRNICKAISEVKDREVAGIGIGTPGFIYQNRLASAPNVEGLNDALNMVKQEYPEIVIENDANCFALAEHKWGAGRGVDNMIGVIWGTGIGGGIIIENDLVKGAIGGAGEFGHALLDHRVEEWREGGPGTWEYLCSGPNIVRRYREAGGEMEDIMPDDLLVSEEPVAQEVMGEVLRDMGVALGNLVNTLNPGIIVMGGGVSNLEVYEELNKWMRKYSISASAASCEVVKNDLGDSAGVLGAASLALK